MIKPLAQVSTGKFLIKTANITQNIGKIVIPRDELDHAAIAEKLRGIQRRFNFPLKNLVFEMYANRRIVLLSNKETVSLPQLFPAYTTQDSGSYTTFVNCTPFVPNNIESLSERNLYSMMQYGTVMNASALMFNKFAYSNGIQKNGGMTYALMVLRAFDKTIGVSNDEMHRNQLLFFLIKYFNINLLSRPVDTADTLADVLTSSTAKAIKDNFESLLAERLKVKNQLELYSLPLLDIIAVMPDTTDWLNRITTRSFLQNFLALFSPSSLLMLERFDYFAAYICTFASDTGLYTSYPAVANAAGNYATAFYNEFIRLTR